MTDLTNATEASIREMDSPLPWIDLETTGLDPHQGSILEVALVITDDLLQPYWTYTAVVQNDPDLVVPMMNDYVLNMHTENGLIDELPEGLPFHLIMQVVGEVLSWLPDATPLCGSSVSFDRLWLETAIGGPIPGLSYRNIDVSSLSETAARWIPGAQATWRNEEPQPEPGQTHRALPDILHSIQQYRCYVDSWGTVA